LRDISQYKCSAGQKSKDFSSLRGARERPPGPIDTASPSKGDFL
jgi:hypothetical protein